MNEKDMQGMTKDKLIAELQDAHFIVERYKEVISEMKLEVEELSHRERQNGSDLMLAQRMITCVTEDWGDYNK